jgi:hypothetical protein
VRPTYFAEKHQHRADTGRLAAQLSRKVGSVAHSCHLGVGQQLRHNQLGVAWSAASDAGQPGAAKAKGGSIGTVAAGKGMGKTGTGESSYSHASQALFYRQLARPARAAHHVEASRYRGRQRQLRRASGWRHTGNEKFAERIVHAHELAGG